MAEIKDKSDSHPIKTLWHLTHGLLLSFFSFECCIQSTKTRFSHWVMSYELWFVEELWVMSYLGGDDLNRQGERNRRMLETHLGLRLWRWAGRRFLMLYATCNSHAWWLENSEHRIHLQKLRDCRNDYAVSLFRDTDCNHDTATLSWECPYELLIVMYSRTFHKNQLFFHYFPTPEA